MTFRGQPVTVIPNSGGHYADEHVCPPPCGNATDTGGFYAVDETTLAQCEPTASWTGLYACADCGALSVIEDAFSIDLEEEK